MKKVLLLSYNFTPRQTVGAIRPTKLAQYLALDGFEVDVVTVRPYGKLDHSLEHVLGLLHRVDEIACPIVGEKPASAAKPQAAAGYKKVGLIRKLKRGYRESKKVLNSRRFAALFDRLVRSDPERFNSYDAVISSCGPVASHLCGLVMKNRCPGVKWIADFRDPMVFADMKGWTRRYRTRLQKQVCREADELVSISYGTFGEIFDDTVKHKAHVIFNGFDRSDAVLGDVKPDGEFSFTCVGTMYNGKRDISALLRALSELCGEGLIDRSKIRLKYAGNCLGVMLEQVGRFGLEDCVTDLGMLDRSGCLRLQAASRQLVLPNWNYSDASGVLPGKFFEFMMTGRPIISLVCGDLPGSEISTIIKEGSLGFAYEAVSDDTDYPALKRYILEDYERFLRGEDCACTPDPDVVGRFDFANTARAFEALL